MFDNIKNEKNKCYCHKTGLPRLIKILKFPKILSISPKSPNFLFFVHKIFSSFFYSCQKFNLI